MPDTNRPLALIDREGERGMIVSRGETEQGEDYVLVERQGAPSVLVPVEAIRQRQEGDDLRVEREFDQFRRASTRAASDGSESTTIPVVQEDLVVDRREVETGRVHVRTRVDERTEAIDIPVEAQRVEIERRPINQLAEQQVEPWYDGDTLVIPVIEERVVVSKQLIVTEEVRIRRIAERHTHHEEVVLRSQQAEIDHTETEND